MKHAVCFRAKLCIHIVPCWDAVSKNISAWQIYLAAWTSIPVCFRVLSPEETTSKALVSFYSIILLLVKVQ
jgi:hypothetical protein